MINARAVELAVKGKYRESSILFKESLEYNGDKSPVLNNLALAYELQEKNRMAFKYYTLALIEKDNYIIRKNFLSMEPRKEEKSREKKLKDKSMEKSGEGAMKEENNAQR